MRHLFVLVLLVSLQAHADSTQCLMKKMENLPGGCAQAYDGKLGEKVAEEVRLLEQLEEGADTLLTYGCQVDLNALLSLARSLDVLNTPISKHGEIESQLTQITQRRTEMIQNIDQCLVKEN